MAIEKQIDPLLDSYINKKLFLMQDEPTGLSDDVVRAAALSNDPEEEYYNFNDHLEENQFVSYKDEMVIEDAKAVLSLFPMDKTQYSAPEMKAREPDLFGDTQNIDKSLNAILFQTRLMFLDVTPIHPEDALKAAAQDSYGYMNLIRKSQLQIFDKENEKVKELLAKTMTPSFAKQLSKFSSKNAADRADFEKIMHFLIDFYAENVLNSRTPIDERKSMIKEWLKKKLTKELSA